MSRSNTFEVVRPYDPEVVRYMMGSPTKLAQYATERDPKLLEELPPEARPMTFVCKLLSRDQRRNVRDQGSDYRANEMAFRYGIVEVRHVPKDNGPLSTVTPHRDDPRMAISEEQLNRLDLGDDDIDDIGQVIRHRSKLGKGVPLRCPVLVSSQRACTLQLALLAERAKEALDTPSPESSGEAKEAHTATTPS